MYLEIYPDIIFILNFFIDFILLFLLKKVNRKTSNVKKMIGASALGAAFAAVASIFPWMNIVIRFVFMNVVAAVIMLRLAFGRMKRMEMLKQVIALYLITYFAGGMINSIYYYTNFRETLINFGNSFVLSNLKWNIIIIVMLCLVPTTYLILWILRWYQSERKETYDVELFYDNQSIHTKGLMDSGNCLYDPIFKKPVMVVENVLIKDLLPAWACSELDAAKKCVEGNEFNFDDNHVLHLRFIPYQSIGKAKGIMVGLMLDKVLINTGKETICNEKVTAAICDNHLSTNDDYHVLLHKELI
ncbi:MAG: sigma-E processing peptidase SpoIIGA [Herbinix sp.]|nr:sigma-E processing peptidase SpoIIGA [Herbinix sp.]